MVMFICENNFKDNYYIKSVLPATPKECYKLIKKTLKGDTYSVTDRVKLATAYLHEADRARAWQMGELGCSLETYMESAKGAFWRQKSCELILQEADVGGEGAKPHCDRIRKILRVGRISPVQRIAVANASYKVDERNGIWHEGRSPGSFAALGIGPEKNPWGRTAAALIRDASDGVV